MPDTPERLVFDHTMEGFFVRGLAGQVTEPLKAKLKAAGLDLDKKLRPAYPFAQWATCIELTAAALRPGTPWEQAYFELGQRMVDGYRDTLMGRALLGMVKLLGPRKALLRTQQNFRSGNNYTEVKVLNDAPGTVTLWMNEGGPVSVFTRGILLAGLRAAGAKDPVVEISGVDTTGCTYATRWT